jgi:hypothetical protein
MMRSEAAPRSRAARRAGFEAPSLARAVIFCIAASSAASVFAASPIVRAGTWDVQVTTGVSETRTDVPELSKAPAAERPKIDAEMRKPVSAPDVVSTRQECITRDAASRWASLIRLDRDYAACSRKSLVQSPKQFKASLTCSSGKVKGDVRFSATPAKYEGEIRIVSHEPSYDKTESKRVQATWVSSVCRAAPDGSGAGKAR